MIKIPINAKSAGAEVIAPNETKVEESATIIPAPFNPRKAKKKPIAAPIPNFKSIGIIFRIASLKPEIVIIKNIILDKTTAAKAAFQLQPIPKIIV